MRSRAVCCEHGRSQQCRDVLSYHSRCHEIAVVLGLGRFVCKDIWGSLLVVYRTNHLR